MSEAATVAGLVTNTAGVVMLFRYGMPYRVASDVVTVSFGAASAEDQATDRRFRRFGMTGLIMIIIGTVLQVAGVVLA